jgi:hypothetical protein
MPKIFDNIENSLVNVLRQTLEISYRSDFCVGYFNLRGWKELSTQVNLWSGGEENCCRLLVGMQRAPEDSIRSFFSSATEERMDNKTAMSLKKKLAQEFKDQLLMGLQQKLMRKD